MKIILAVLVLTVFVAAVVDSRRLSYSRRLSNLNLNSEEKELLLQIRAALQLNSSCNAITYSLNQTAINTYDDKSYQCPDVTLSKSGYCILLINDAIKRCNADPKCSGYAMTDMLDWQDQSDVAVQLFTTTTSPTSRPAKPNRWFIFQKTCWKFY
ncbi:unnamed protein product [Adineta steineri]|uniref:Uncharacterized protein n=1 Tax=Adineta steineri TaxID=433720 RepID=A0A816A1G5_9BILA|nr:unnamed protein product [Adineta steineri]